MNPGSHVLNLCFTTEVHPPDEIFFFFVYLGMYVSVVCVCACGFMFICAHLCVQMRICMCVCMCSFSCVCLRVQMYICIHVAACGAQRLTSGRHLNCSPLSLRRQTFSLGPRLTDLTSLSSQLAQRFRLSLNFPKAGIIGELTHSPTWPFVLSWVSELQSSRCSK